MSSNESEEEIPGDDVPEMPEGFIEEYKTNIPEEELEGLDD